MINNMEAILNLIDEIDDLNQLNEINTYLQNKLNDVKASELSSKVLKSPSIKKLSKKQQKFASNVKKIYRDVESADYHVCVTTKFCIDDIEIEQFYNGTNDGEGSTTFAIGDVYILSRDECFCTDIDYDDIEDDDKDKLTKLFSKYKLSTEDCYDTIITIMDVVMNSDF